ncbi:MAG: hypothetical protein KDK66_04175 [Deltaproteobacteria bacterium]|nr:hypothetical protein [Deltaproteobacteria bacterium]
MVDLRQIQNLPPRVDQRPLTAEDQRSALQPQAWRFNIEGENFDFKKGKLLLNGQDLAEHVSTNLSQMGAYYWTNLARRLGRYRDWAMLHVEDTEALGRLFGLVNALLAKVYGRIKKKFNETIQGVSFHLEDGELIINGINVGACLSMVQKKRSQKGKIFLKGLRGRLTVLLENHGHSSVEHIRDTLENFAAKIDLELEVYPPEVIALPPPSEEGEET